MAQGRDGHSLKVIIAGVNPILRGWYVYFKHCHETVFPEMDGYVRMRIRSILRKRSKRKGRAKGKPDHKRWPNVFFSKRGLFSLTTAHAQAVKSPTG